MAGHHRDAVRVVADQRAQAATDFQRGVPVVSQREDRARVFTAHADQVGDAMDEHACLAGTGAGKHKHVGVLAVVGDDGALVRLGQGLDDGFPGLRCGLQRQFLFAPRQPALAERLARQPEVIDRELRGVGDALDAAFGVLGHDVNLPGQLVVMQLQGLVVALLELQLPVVLQVQRHCGAEDGQPLVEAQNLLFVQPEQRALDQLAQVGRFRDEQAISGDAGGEFA